MWARCPAAVNNTQGTQSSQGTHAATPQQDKGAGSIRKHRRLLRRRSTDSDVCVAVTEAQASKETVRIIILEECTAAAAAVWQRMSWTYVMRGRWRWVTRDPKVQRDMRKT